VNPKEIKFSYTLNPGIFGFRGTSNLIRVRFHVTLNTRGIGCGYASAQLKLGVDSS